ncbi:MAG: hypothetical protein M1341_05605 [Candidatus Thermoplasmatota archaeon]|jgi:hypothetical protein|nr:hypothetical protein [Candidatus Thermoplasmatota archaeon]
MAEEQKSRFSDDSKYLRRAVDEDRQRSSTGFLLFAIGLFLAWIPYILFVGDILLFIGLLMIFFGRNGFSDAHVRNVNMAIVLLVLMIIIAIAVAVFFALSIDSTLLSLNSGTITQSQALQQLSAALNTYLGALIVVSFIGGITYVLIPYALLERGWRTLLIVAFFIMVAVSITSFVLVSGSISNMISSAGSNSFATISANAQSQTTLYGLLAAIPDILLGIIYLHARSRIEWGATN